MNERWSAESLRAELRKRPRKNRRRIQDQFRTLIRQGLEVSDGMTAAVFNRRPKPGRWSVGECLDHLNATARAYLPVLTQSIEDAVARGLSSDRRDGRTLLGRVLVWTQEPPPRLRMNTFTQIQPESGLDPAAVREEFEALHEEIIVRINEAGNLDRKKIRIRSVLDPRLRLSLDDWFHFLAAHGRRHLWQAAGARETVEEDHNGTTAHDHNTAEARDRGGEADGPERGR